MKKSNILVLLLLVLACSFIYAGAKNIAIPTEEQVQKLVVAAWKEPIESIDISFYKDYTQVPMSIEQIRKEVEKIVDNLELKGRSLDELQPYEIERRNKEIESNLKIWIEAQKFPRKIKSLVRISGDKQRIDFVKVGPYEELDIDTPFVHTFINTKDANTGSFVRYHYASDINTVFVDTTKQWTKDVIIQFAGTPAMGALKAFLGIDQGGTPTSPKYIPDPNKIAEFARTGLVRIEYRGGVKVKRPGVNKISIYPDPNNPHTMDMIEIGDPNYFPTVLICDRKDYSRVYRTEFHNPRTNQLIYLRECNNFDPNGFPQNITEIKYDKDGNFVEKSVYKIIKVELNPSIPSEIFGLHPPQGYKVVDQRSKK